MRTLGALAAGLLIGIVTIEAVCAMITLLLDPAAPQPLISRLPLDAVSALAVAAAWFGGGLLAGCMASAVTGRRLPGWLCGTLLGLSMLLVVNLNDPGSVLALIAPAWPLSGALVGSGLARRCEDCNGADNRHTV
ncbi:MAG: hypothetical protein HND55_13705 [Pseudomonadota bacterium]|nr:MAG: hypothetical protein HND55_13705 [Pseudomonadota bacterium]